MPPATPDHNDFADAELPPVAQPPQRVFVGPPADARRAPGAPHLPGSK